MKGLNIMAETTNVTTEPECTEKDIVTLRIENKRLKEAYDAACHKNEALCAQVAVLTERAEVRRRQDEDMDTQRMVNVVNQNCASRKEWERRKEMAAKKRKAARRKWLKKVRDKALALMVAIVASGVGFFLWYNGVLGRWGATGISIVTLIAVGWEIRDLISLFAEED